MFLEVDETKCQAHNRCVGLAPDLFGLDDLGYAHAIPAEELAPDQLRSAELAAANCPEGAIQLVKGSRQQ